MNENTESRDGIQVVELTRANTAAVSKWPATGWAGGYRWLQGTGGPLSPVIRPGDSVSLSIWDADPNSLITSPNERVATMNNIPVSSSGEIFVPYIGNVSVNGMTPDAARESIQTDMERVSPNAQVQLAFLPGSQNTVDLVRGMARPGPLQLQGRNVTVLSAIAEGNGIATSLRNPLVRVIRDHDTYSIPAERLLADASLNAVLRGGDKIIVEEDKRFFTALGASGIQAPVYFETQNITAIEAMSMLGGLAEVRADPTGILILRDYPHKAVTRDGVHGPTEPQVIFVMDITTADGLFAARKFQVQPGDTVMATESPAVALTTLLSIANAGALLGRRI